MHQADVNRAERIPNHNDIMICLNTSYPFLREHTKEHPALYGVLVVKHVNEDIRNFRIFWQGSKCGIFEKFEKFEIFENDNKKRTEA